MKDYDVTAARGFIDLFGLPMKVRGLRQGDGGGSSGGRGRRRRPARRQAPLRRGRGAVPVDRDRLRRTTRASTTTAPSASPSSCDGAASSSPRAGWSSPGCVALPHARIRSILVSEAGLAGLRELAADGLETCRGADLPRAPDVIDAIGGFHFHRGCLAIAERPPALDPATLIAAAAPGRPLVVVEGVAQADNVGSILRNAQAFGAAGVLLDAAHGRSAVSQGAADGDGRRARGAVGAARAVARRAGAPPRRPASSSPR